MLIAAIRAAFAVHDGLWGLQQQVQQQMQQQQARLDTLNAELGTTGAKVEQMAVSLRAAMNHRTLVLGLLAVVLPALLYFVR